MKKILLTLSLFVLSLFSYSSANMMREENRLKVELLSNESCDKYDSSVMISKAGSSLKWAGVIVGKYGFNIYIATTSKYYEKKGKYEVSFSDGKKNQATVLGVAKEDEVMILEVYTFENYCTPKLSRTEFSNSLQDLVAIGTENNVLVEKNTTISKMGILKNPNDEKFALYYAGLLTEGLADKFLGAPLYDITEDESLVGLVTGNNEEYRGLSNFIDIDNLMNIAQDLVSYGKYQKRYLKYNLLDVSSLTEHQKYLYSVDDSVNEGVLVSSIHYINYFYGGLNQGMVIIAIDDVDVKDCYELDKILVKHQKGDIISLKVRTITGKNRLIKIKL